MPPADRDTSLWKNTPPSRISSMGKSRATGCTSAEYDRPVSLRSRRSWMPARKSWASRIIGLREVRAMAVSTSCSTAASEPCTISTSTGSALRPASAVSVPNGNWVGARREPVSASWWWAAGAEPLWTVWQLRHMSALLSLLGARHDDVGEVVDPRSEAGVDGHGGAELLDDH